MALVPAFHSHPQSATRGGQEGFPLPSNDLTSFARTYCKTSPCDHLAQGGGSASRSRMYQAAGWQGSSLVTQTPQPHPLRLAVCKLLLHGPSCSSRFGQAIGITVTQPFSKSFLKDFLTSSQACVFSSLRTSSLPNTTSPAVLLQRGNFFFSA